MAVNYEEKSFMEQAPGHSYKSYSIVIYVYRVVNVNNISKFDSTQSRNLPVNGKNVLKDTSQLNLNVFNANIQPQFQMMQNDSFK